jgi:peptidoglycan hydrolase-like protein with peptidoglycan-binding domain
MKSPAVSKLNVILIATFVLVALPSAAHAASTAVLARGAGYGSSNGSPQVELLQHRLRLVGVNPGPIDGRFGPLTEAAVRRYQLRDGLMIDGLAGPQTRTALRHAVTQVGRGAGYGMPHGSTRIRRIQRSLRLAGARPGAIDGRFGAFTQAAIVRFQHSHGLAASGLAGVATVEALDRQVRNVSVEKPRSSRPAAGKPAAAKPVKGPAGKPVKGPAGKPGNARPVKVAAGSEGDARPAKATGENRGHARPAKPTTVPPGRGGIPTRSVPSAPAKGPRQPYAGKDGGGRDLARIELILFAAALLLAVAGIFGLPEKIARRFAGSPPPPPPTRPVVEDVEPDPTGKVVDGSRRPPRPRPPGHRLRPDRGDEPERTSSYR